MLADSAGRNDAIDAAICEYLTGVDSGPAFDVDAWLSRHADIREDLLQFLDDQALASSSAVFPLKAIAGGENSHTELEITTDFSTSILSGSTSTNSGTPANGPTSHPQTVGDIRLGRLLGTGGMGRVYEGVDAAGQRVAVKLLAPNWTRSQESINRFRKEGALASIINHPRCVFVKSADTDDGVPYIVMELMPGDTLRDLVSRKGRVPYRQAVQLMLDVAEGLAEAHSRGMIHRDVKPANCYLESTGRVKIGDFGLARSVVQPSELTVTGGFVGTPLYASPEQIRGKQLDARTDIYSLTATLYFLLTGRAPFASENPTQTIARIVSEDPPSVRDEVAEVPLGLDRIIQKGLARDPEKRPQSIVELISSLRPFVSDGPTSAPLGTRIGAMLVDTGIFSIFNTLFLYILNPRVFMEPEKWIWLYAVLGSLAWFAYLFIQEAICGASFGKRLFRLQIVDASSLEKAAWYRYFVRSMIYVVLTGFLVEVVGLFVEVPSAFPAYYLFTLVGACVGYVALLTTYPVRKERALLHDWLTHSRVVHKPALAPGDTPWNVQDQSTVGGEAQKPASIGRFEILATLTDEKNPNNTCRVLVARDPQLDRNVWLVSCTELPSAKNARLDSSLAHSQTTRLRRIQQVDDAGQQWMVYSAVEGESVEHMIARGVTLEWPQVRLLLEQLVSDMAAEGASGEEPQIRSLSQVWVDVRGRLVLLDFPLNPLAQPQAEPMGTLATARAMATGLLNFQEQGQAADAGQSVLLPAHATKMIERMSPAHVNAFASPQQLQEELERTERLPHRIELKQRLVQIALMFSLLAGAYGATLSLSRLANQIGVTRSGDALLYAEFARRMEVDDDLFQDWQQELETKRAEWDFPALPARDDLGRIAEEIDKRYASEYALRLSQVVAPQGMLLETSPYRTNLLESRNAYVLQQQPEKTEKYRFYRDANSVPDTIPATFSALQVARLLNDTAWIARAYQRRVPLMIGIALIPIIVLMIWDAVFRGGWSAWLAGIRYVDARNRPAGFLRFAIRSLIIWSPMLAFGTGIAVLDSSATTGSLQAANTLYAIYALLPALFVGLTLFNPQRQLHDRLSGVYPVAR